MLRKYLVVLGYSGKWHTTFCPFFFFSSFDKCYLREGHQMMNCCLLHLWSHQFNSLFFLSPTVLDGLHLWRYKALKQGFLELWISRLHVCSALSKQPLYKFFPPAYFVCILVLMRASEGLFLCAFLRSHSESPSESDVIIKGSGCPFCYCVSFEMQTLQWIFLWAMNV